MFSNKTFYPTPSRLASKMISKIKGDPGKILDGQAGKGDLIKAIQERFGQYRNLDISAIEIDETLQATLRGKGIKVIDSDFLNYAGMDKFDLIIGNPPFDDGDKHLLKAIDIMYRGQIIYLLNAETVKNPYTNIRKDLVKKLTDLKAEIEYIQGAFKDAERPTGVEIALINIVIERQVEDDLFAGATDTIEHETPDIEKNYELSTGRTIEELVAEYNQIIDIGQQTIIGYFRNYKKIGKYIGLNEDAEKRMFNSDADMTAKMQGHVNHMLSEVRTDFWRRTLGLDEVRRRLTKKKQDEFEHQLAAHCHMDFTERNIRSFVLNLIGGHEKTITDSVLEIFELFTRKHCWSDGLYDDNIYMFNGWKTNKAFKVNKKVIIPIYGSYGSAFTDSYNGEWRLNHGAADSLRDIDLVLNYFAGMGPYTSISDALESAFALGQSSRIKSTFFTCTVYKKGTIHLTFNDEDILRRFNVVACKGKEWLPHDYGKKAYEDMPVEEKAVVESFEGVESYTENLGRPLFPEMRPMLRIAGPDMAAV